MTFRQRLTGIGIALAILIGCLPLAAITTILTASLWRWFEEQFGIEAYGHSGPAEWCYLVVYALFIAVCSAIWSRIRKNQPKYR